MVRARGLVIRRWSAPAAGSAAALRPLRAIAPIRPGDGAVIVQDGRTTATLSEPGEGAAVTLTAILHADAAPVARKYRIADGALVRSAGTDEAASRTAMLLSLLRETDRADAGHVFAAATRAGAAHDRWNAVREWLALDAAPASARLAAMAASDPDAELRALAARTHALVEERRRCRA